MSKKIKKADDKPEEKVYGNPEYSEKDDIYNQDEKESLLDDEADAPVKGKKKAAGEDLDIPGSELDDADEEIGEEDEENNYYSLGGDNHDDLEEDNGD